MVLAWWPIKCKIISNFKLPCPPLVATTPSNQTSELVSIKTLEEHNKINSRLACPNNKINNLVSLEGKDKHKEHKWHLIIHLEAMPPPLNQMLLLEVSNHNQCKCNNNIMVASTTMAITTLEIRIINTVMIWLINSNRCLHLLEVPKLKLNKHHLIYLTETIILNQYV